MDHSVPVTGAVPHAQNDLSVVVTLFGHEVIRANRIHAPRIYKLIPNLLLKSVVVPIKRIKAVI